MQILLACAKIMTDPGNIVTPALSTPAFAAEAMQFAADMTALDVDDIAATMHCSRQIAAETALRYRDFFSDTPLQPAVLAYYGQAYKTLRAREFTPEQLLYAEQHLWITSFLYGLLRPLNGIHPYRMEGNVFLPSANGENMFAFWRSRLTQLLIDSVKTDDGVLLHLATEEMQHLFDWSRVKREVTVVQPQFLVENNGRTKTVTVYAKSCRGAMTRYVITHQITSPTQLLQFNYQGFNFSERLSNDTNLVFVL
ncbi:MAG: YaaA family protein [Muribaculaceae bacterium]